MQGAERTRGGRLVYRLFGWVGGGPRWETVARNRTRGFPAAMEGAYRAICREISGRDRTVVMCTACSGTCSAWGCSSRTPPGTTGRPRRWRCSGGRRRTVSGITRSAPWTTSHDRPLPASTASPSPLTWTLWSSTAASASASTSAPSSTASRTVRRGACPARVTSPTPAWRRASCRSGPPATAPTPPQSTRNTTSSAWPAPSPHAPSPAPSTGWGGGAEGEVWSGLGLAPAPFTPTPRSSLASDL